MPKEQQYFKRYEIKYLLSEPQYNELQNRLVNHMAVDRFGESEICNCYFDTPDYRMIRQSLEKGIYKEKLRLRSYGMPEDDSSKVYLELKKKYDGIVYKRREALSYGQAQQVMARAVPSIFDELGLDSQIYREIAWVLRFYENLYPAMFLCYRRIAMYEIEKESDSVATGNSSLRITFDRDIRWRTDDVDLLHGTEGKELLDTGQRIMEVKAPGAMPLWLVKLLEELAIYPTSYSKYGRAYEQLFREKNEKLIKDRSV